jgi:hypothetical protein
MFAAACLIALASLQQETRPKSAEPKTPDVPKAFAQLPTMQRMLSQKLHDKRLEIGPEVPAQNVPRGGGAGGSAGGGGLGSGAPAADPTNSVATDFYSRLAGYGVVGNTHAEYVPGLAAIFSLDVAVRTEVAEPPKSKKNEDETKSAAKSDDDAAWEAVSRNESQDAAKRLMDLARENEAHAASLRFAQGSVDVMERTILDTIWRFGHKLELEHGERLAVVVEVQPARPLNTGNWLWSQAAGGGSSVGAGAAEGAAGGGEGTVADPNVATANRFTLSALFNATLPPSYRMVVQVSADDLAAFHAGTLERDELAKRTRIQRFAMPSSRNPYGNGFWNNGTPWTSSAK